MAPATLLHPWNSRRIIQCNSLEIQKEDQGDVRLFAARHRKPPCRSGRNLGGPSILYGIERADLSRVHQTNRATKEELLGDAHAVVDASRPAQDMCGLYS